MILFVTGRDYRLPFETFVLEGFTICAISIPVPW